MNPSTFTFNTAEHITFIAPNVFDTMLGLAVIIASPGAFPGERVSGAVGIAGERVNGTVYLHLPEPLAQETARAMLQIQPDQVPGDSDVHDVVGELANMIGGALKSLLCDADIYCAISTPSVIRGAFAVEAPPGVRAEMFYFTCLGQRLAVEVHLQIN